MSKKIKHLIVDTTAFIRAANLQDLAENVYTIQEVIDEISNDRQRKKLVVLPYDLVVKNVFTENIKFVTEFSKKTGDYGSLSATDVKVIALTYQIEKEKVGIEHLKAEPTMQKTIKITGIRNQHLDSNVKENSDGITVTNEGPKENNCNSQQSFKLNMKNDEDRNSEEITKQIENINLEEQEDENIMVKISDEEEIDGEDSDSDGGEWITPTNLMEKKKEVENGEFEDKCVDVACVTSDFAMQNVLKQIGLHVTAVDGRIIKQLRTFIYRCTTCFKMTSVMTKLFCPKCGHATLKKVAVSVDEQGNQHIHINGRKPLTARGKRFSLPTPRGGLHFQYPILTEDQHIHKRYATKMARNKTDALDPDYIAGYSPFVMKDANSKSAVLGVRANKQDIKYWMKNYSKGKKK